MVHAVKIENDTIVCDAQGTAEALAEMLFYSPVKPAYAIVLPDSYVVHVDDIISMVDVMAMRDTDYWRKAN